MVAILMIAALFSACGEKQNAASPDEAAITETTVVLETTADGGTIEQDSEGNKITKDENGKVVSVEDKDGNPIDVTEYLTTHTWVELNGDSSGGSNGSDSSDGSGDSNDDNVEESIPVVIATIPDEDDTVELPDF